MQVVCFMLVCLHYRPGSIRRIRWTGGMFAVYGTMGLRLIWFLLGLMLVCSHHKVGNFMSDPRVHATIGLGSHMCQLCFHVSMFTMLSGNLCSLDPFYDSTSWVCFWCLRHHGARSQMCSLWFMSICLRCRMGNINSDPGHNPRCRVGLMPWCE